MLVCSGELELCRTSLADLATGPFLDKSRGVDMLP